MLHSIDIRLQRYRVRFEAIDHVVLPAFPGSAWRGAFGHALRDLACVRACGAPSACPLSAPCAYRYLFETPRPPDAAKMRLYERVPHPFVLDSEGTGGVHPPGGSLELRTVLVGRANDRIDDTVRALARAAESGVGPRRGRLRLARVDAEMAVGGEEWRPADRPSPPATRSAGPVPPPPAAVRVSLCTPLRLKEQERNVTPATFRSHHLLRNVLRRLSLLSYFHTDEPIETDFRELSASARIIEHREARLTWRDWQRYSTRQRTLLSMGGIVGSFVLDATQLAAWWPILWIGQWVHAGKGTSMGLGKYRIEDVTSLPATDGDGSRH